MLTTARNSGYDDVIGVLHGGGALHLAWIVTINYVLSCLCAQNDVGKYAVGATWIFGSAMVLCNEWSVVTDSILNLTLTLTLTLCNEWSVVTDSILNFTKHFFLSFLLPFFFFLFLFLFFFLFLYIYTPEYIYTFGGEVKTLEDCYTAGGSCRNLVCLVCF